jgi:predicted acylesterase/phospholipase RssA
MDKTRLLSIDGGGIRGAIPAYLLTMFENDIQNRDPDATVRIVDLFDVFAGTSTGAIMATALAAGIETDKIRGMYRNKGRQIFPNKARDIREWGKGSLWKKPFAWIGAGGAGAGSWVGSKLSPRYPSDGLRAVLESVFVTDGNPPRQLTLADIQRPRRLLVTTFNATNRRPIVFDSFNQNHSEHTLAAICLASAAAPTYFPAHTEEIDDLDMVLIDGGMMANNPSALAVAMLLQAGAKPEDIVMVSLGTGQYLKSLDPAQAQEHGEVGWLLDQRIFDAFFDGNAAVTTEILPVIVPTENIFRFQVDLPEKLMEMDRVENVTELETRTNIYWREPDVQTKFDDAVSALTGAAPTRIDLNGSWQSTFTWTDPITKKQETSVGTVEISQSGLSIEGHVLKGTYEYEFSGRIEHNDLIGEWEGLVHDLMGPYLLRFNIETNNRLDGYWIGTGGKVLYNGQWTLDRLPPQTTP